MVNQTNTPKPSPKVGYMLITIFYLEGGKRKPVSAEDYHQHIAVGKVFYPDRWHLDVPELQKMFGRLARQRLVIMQKAGSVIVSHRGLKAIRNMKFDVPRPEG